MCSVRAVEKVECLNVLTGRSFLFAWFGFVSLLFACIVWVGLKKGTCSASLFFPLLAYAYINVVKRSKNGFDRSLDETLKHLL